MPTIVPGAGASGGLHTGLGGIEGAWNGDRLVGQRLALEQGRYLPVGELSADSSEQELQQNFGYRHSEVGARQAPHQPEGVSKIN